MFPLIYGIWCLSTDKRTKQWNSWKNRNPIKSGIPILLLWNAPQLPNNSGRSFNFWFDANAPLHPKFGTQREFYPPRVNSLRGNFTLPSLVQSQREFCLSVVLILFVVNVSGQNVCKKRKFWRTQLDSKRWKSQIIGQIQIFELHMIMKGKATRCLRWSHYSKSRGNLQERKLALVSAQITLTAIWHLGTLGFFQCNNKNK